MPGLRASELQSGEGDGDPPPPSGLDLGNSARDLTTLGYKVQTFPLIMRSENQSCSLANSLLQCG